MALLTQLVDIVTWLPASIAQILITTFTIGSAVGQFIFYSLRFLITFLVGTLENIILLIIVIYEDYYAFIEDVTAGLGSVTNGIGRCIYTLRDLLRMALWYIIESCVVLAFGSYNFINSTFLTCIECIGLLIKGVLLVGSSIWLGLGFLPAVLISLFETYCKFVEFVLQDSYAIIPYLLRKFKICMNNILWFFFIDVPVDSIFGLLLGSLIIYLTIKHFDAIVSFICRTSLHLYNTSQAFGTFLWTGNFTTTQMLQQIANEDVYEAEELVELVGESTLCIVCQDNPREVVILPCKHMCLCEECSLEIRRIQRLCPVCRTIIRRIIKVYK